MAQLPLVSNNEALRYLGIGIDTYDWEIFAELYDAVMYFHNDETYQSMYGWDCDSLLVLNPDVVVLA